MDELENELDDNISLSEHTKDEIKSFYRAWTTCINNKIIIENLKNETLDINETVNYDNKVIPVELTSTLHFINCQNLSINLNRKVNHITIERCDNVKIVINSGCISGLDTIKSKYINVLIDNKSIYFIDVGTSSDCNYCIRDYVYKNDDMYISSIDSMDINLYIIDDDKNIEHKSDYNLSSVFGNYKLIKLV